MKLDTDQQEIRSRLAATLYNMGLRSEDLIDALAIAQNESVWDEKAYNGEDDDISYGLFQINTKIDAEWQEIINFLTGGDGSTLEKEKLFDYDTQISAFVLKYLLQDYAFSDWATHPSYSDTHDVPWTEAKQKKWEEARTDAIEFLEITPGLNDWEISDPQNNLFTGVVNEKIARGQQIANEYMGQDTRVDGMGFTGSRGGNEWADVVRVIQKTVGADEDGSYGPNTIKALDNWLVEQDIDRGIMLDGIPQETTSYFSNTNLEGRPMSVSSTDTNENVVYNEELDRYEPISFTEDGLEPRDDFAPEPLLDERDEDQILLDDQEERRSFDPGLAPDLLDKDERKFETDKSILESTENAKRNNPKLHFYRWLAGRDDATIDGVNIIDIIEADQSGFEIGTDQYNEWVQSLVSQTEFYRNHADTYVTNASEWYAGGLDEGWTERRKDLVSSYVQSINNLSGKLNLDLDDDEILELARVAWFNGFDVQELQDYVAEAENVSFDEGAIAGGSISDTRSEVKNLYRKYLMIPNEILLEESSKKIFRGTSTIGFIEDELRQQAADVYPVFADRILAGRSPLQILSGYDSIFSSVTGIQPQWDGEQKDVGIKLASGAKLANGDDVNTGNLATWLRTDTSVGYDAMPKAINNAYSLVKGLGQTFGAVA